MTAQTGGEVERPQPPTEIDSLERCIRRLNYAIVCRSGLTAHVYVSDVQKLIAAAMAHTAAGRNGG